jgi:putative Holliday junction resolvase
MIASPLGTVPSGELLPFLEKYFTTEDVEVIVVGMPLSLQNADTHATAGVRQLLVTLAGKFPGHKVVTVDERFTSKMAMDAMISGGMKKKDRARKENVDKISAAIILQSYLAQIS